MAVLLRMFCKGTVEAFAHEISGLDVQWGCGAPRWQKPGTSNGIALVDPDWCSPAPVCASTAANVQMCGPRGCLDADDHGLCWLGPPFIFFLQAPLDEGAGCLQGLLWP